MGSDDFCSLCGLQMITVVHQEGNNEQGEETVTMWE